MVRMDLRVVTIDVARQEVMPMTVDAVVYFRVIDPAAAVVRVEKYLKATSLISQTTLRSALGQAELDEVLLDILKAARIAEAQNGATLAEISDRTLQLAVQSWDTVTALAEELRARESEASS